MPLIESKQCDQDPFHDSLTHTPARFKSVSVCCRSSAKGAVGTSGFAIKMMLHPPLMLFTMEATHARIRRFARFRCTLLPTRFDTEKPMRTVSLRLLAHTSVISGVLCERPTRYV